MRYYDELLRHLHFQNHSELQERQILDMESQLQSLLGKEVLPDAKLAGKNALLLPSLQQPMQEAVKPDRPPLVQPSPRLRFLIPDPEASKPNVAAVPAPEAAGDRTETQQPASAQSHSTAGIPRQMRAKRLPKAMERPDFSNSVKLPPVQQEDSAWEGRGASGGYLNSNQGWGSTRRRSQTPGVGLYEDALGRMKRTAQR